MVKEEAETDGDWRKPSVKSDNYHFGRSMTTTGKHGSMMSSAGAVGGGGTEWRDGRGDLGRCSPDREPGRAMIAVIRVAIQSSTFTTSPPYPRCHSTRSSSTTVARSPRSALALGKSPRMSVLAKSTRPSMSALTISTLRRVCLVHGTTSDTCSLLQRRGSRPSTQRVGSVAQRVLAHHQVVRRRRQECSPVVRRESRQARRRPCRSLPDSPPASYPG